MTVPTAPDRSEPASFSFDEISQVEIAKHIAKYPAGKQASAVLPLLDLVGPSEASTYFMPLALAWEDHDEERMKALMACPVAKAG